MTAVASTDHRLFSGRVILVFFVRVGGMGLGFLLNIAIANIMGPGGYGTIAYGLAAVALLSVISTFGLDQHAAMWIGQRIAAGGLISGMRSYFRTAHRLVIPFAIFISIMCLLVMPFYSQALRPALLFAALASPIAALILVYEGMLRSSGRPVAASLPGLVIRPTVAIGALLAITPVMSWSTQLVLELLLISLLVAWAFALLQALGRVRISSQAEPEAQITVSSLARSAAPFFGVALATTALNRADVLVLGLLVDSRQVGIYAAAYNMAAISLLALQVVNFVIGPHLASLYTQGDSTGLRVWLRRSRWWAVAASLPILLLYFTVPSLALSLFGPEFRSGATVLMVLSLGMGCNAATGSVGNFLMMSGHGRAFGKLLLGAFVVECLGLAFAVPSYGIVGSAIVVSVVMAGWNLVAFILARRLVGAMGN